MRYSKAALLPVVAVFLLMATVPALAWDGGGHWMDVIEIERDHPWQDENEAPGSIARVIPPIVVTPVAVSITFDLPSWLTRLFVSKQPALVIEATALECRRAGGSSRIRVSGRNDLR